MNNVTQWYNENELRSYPLSEQATNVAQNGAALPYSAIVDLGIMAPPDLFPLYVSSVRLTPDYVSVGISNAVRGLLTCTVAKSNLQPYRAYGMTSVSDNCTGWIAFGSYVASTIEDYRFSGVEASMVDPRAIRPVDVLPITDLYSATGLATSRVSGLVTLQAGPNVVLERNNNQIIVRLNKDFANAAAGTCRQGASRKTCGLPPIRSINGVCADEFGVLTVRLT